MPEPADHRRQGSRWQASFREAGPYMGLGIQLAVSMVLFTLGGYLLDKWLQTTPWLTIAGAVLGMVAVFAYLVRLSQSLSKKQKPPKEE